MATRLQDIREQEAELNKEIRKELKHNGTVFHPNLFVEIDDNGIRIWSENGETVTIPDTAVKPLKTVLAWMTGTA